ncbi:protein required for normal CLN1 and CLN2 G1 cyclin expression [Umbelopsis sp. WA50703]
MASTNGHVTRSRTIEVPLQHEQVLEVVCEDLPGNPVELTDIFQQEGVGLLYYRLLAFEYYRQSKYDESIKVLRAGLNAANGASQAQSRQKLPLLILLATLSIQLAKMSVDTTQKQTYMTEAVQLINDADRINNQYEPTFIIKGILYLQRGDLNEAFRSFTMTLEKLPSCVPALIGKGRIQYTRKQYRQALKTYQTALSYATGNEYNVEIRLGIGLCYHQLGMNAEAKTAFKRCLQLNPSKSNPISLILLAIMELNESKDRELGIVHQETSLKQGLQHMQMAHAANKKDPVVLNMLANHFFLTKDFAKSVKCATRSYNISRQNQVKAEAAYQVARAQHQMQQYDDAFKHYGEALQLNPDHILSQFGIGQIHLNRGEIDKAIQYFDKVYTTEPRCIEALKVLGSLYALAGKKEKAMECLVKVLGEIKDDPMLLIEVAQLSEQTDEKRTLKAYEQAVELYKLKAAENGDESHIMPEVLNNIAAMYHMRGDLEDAEHHYGLAVKECERQMSLADTDDSSKQRIAGFELTISYNLGRLCEDNGDLEKAVEIYKKIINGNPGYADAHLRLGAIEQNKGHVTDAIEHYKDVFDSNANNADAWTMIGQAQMSMNEKICKRSFEKVLKDCDKNDLYTHVALGNYHSNTARELKGDDKRAARAEAYKLATGFFSQTLKRDPYNVYAANGIAITLAERGHINEAKEIFNQVRESAVNNPSIWINLAHVHVELGQFKQAAVMYENASKKYYDNKDANVLLCIAKMHFMIGKADKNAEEMLLALSYSEQAYQADLSDKTILYDIALVHQTYAQLISDLPKDQRTTDQMRQAITGLEASKSGFQTLLDVSPDEHVHYDRKIVEQRQRHGESLRTQIERKLADQVQFEEERKQRTEEARKKREGEHRRRELEDQERREQEVLERKRMEDERQRIMEKVREENLLLASQEVGESDDEEKKKKKRRKDLGDGIIDDEEMEDAEAEAPKRPRKRKEKDPSEKKEPKRPKRRKSEDLDADKPKRRVRTKQIIESEDEEDEALSSPTNNTEVEASHQSRIRDDGDDEDEDEE